MPGSIPVRCIAREETRSGLPLRRGSRRPSRSGGSWPFPNIAPWSSPLHRLQVANQVLIIDWRFAVALPTASSSSRGRFQMQQRRTAGGLNGFKAMLIRLNTPTMACAPEAHRMSKEANAVDRAVVSAGSVVTVQSDARNLVGPARSNWPAFRTKRKVVQE